MTIGGLNQGNLLYNLNNQVQMPPQPASQPVDNGIFTQEKSEKENSMKTPLVIGTIALAALGCYLGRGKIKKFLGFAQENAPKPNTPKPTPHTEPAAPAPKPEKPPVSPKPPEKPVETLQKLENGNQLITRKYSSGEIVVVTKNPDGLMLEKVIKDANENVKTKINREYNGKELAKEIRLDSGVKTVTTYGEKGAYVHEITDVTGKTMHFKELTPKKFTYKDYINGKTEEFVSEFTNPTTVSTTRTITDANGNLLGDKLTLVTKYNSKKCIIRTADELYSNGELIMTKTYKHAPGATDTFAVVQDTQTVMEKGFENQAEMAENAINLFQKMGVNERLRLNPY